MSDIKFGVGCSKNWDPEVAGVEATTKALEQIGEEPKFLLIFSTIHYAKEKDGLKRLLYGCRSLIDENVPSVGGTIVGFICPEGCHTRGVVVVAGSGAEIDISSCFAGNPRRSKKAAVSTGKKFADEITERLSRSKNRNRLVIEVMSGPIEPKIMTNKTLRFILKKIPNEILWSFRDIFATIAVRYFKQGPGMEEEVLHSIGEVLDDYSLLGISTFDNFKCLRHYQFYNNHVLDSFVVGLGIAINNEVLVDRSLPILLSGKKLNISRGWENFWIDQINNQPAVSEYLRNMGWPKGYIQTHVEEVTKKTFYYGLGFRDDNWFYTFPAGFFFGETIGTNREIKKEDLELFVTSSKETINNFIEFLRILKDRNTEFTIINEGMNILGILGEKIFLMKEMLDEILNNSPYLVLFGSGEHSKRPNEKPIFCNYSMAMLSILKSDN